MKDKMQAQDEKKMLSFSLVVLLLLIAINGYYIHSESIKHDEQLVLIKENLRNDAIAQYKNIKSLVIWGAKSDNDKANGFAMHSQNGQDGMSFALPFLEEKNKNGIYYFKLTSLNPINQKNYPDIFEAKGLKKLEKDKALEYFEEFSKNDYNFIGRLDIEESCVKCHSSNGEKLGDLRGGVRVTVPLDAFNEQISQLNDETYQEMQLLIILFFILLATIIFFMYIVRKKNKIITSYNLNLEKEVHARTLDLELTFEQTIHSFIKMMESRDAYTAGHSFRVQKYANIIARRLQYDDEFIEKLDKAAYLHDIGKLYTPDAVLLKPGRLSKVEYQLIQEHAIKGYETLSQIDLYKDIAVIVGAHHERFDGSGYPYGLAGDKIPVESRILAVADAFDAMTTNRIYRPRLSVQEALTEIQNVRGIEFDPEITDAAVEALKNVKIEQTTQLPESGSEHQRLAYHYKDSLTDTYNISYLTMLLSVGLNNTHFECFNRINLKNIHQYNQNHGWNEGNKLLISFAEMLMKKYPSSQVFRIFGDDFVVLNKRHLEVCNNDFENLSILIDTGVVVDVKHYDLRNKNEKDKVLAFLDTAI